MLTRLIASIVGVIVIGIAQIALASSALSAGTIAKWGGVILLGGMMLNIAIIVYPAGKTTFPAQGD